MKTHYVEQYFIDNILCVNTQDGGTQGMSEIIEETMEVNGSNIFYGEI